MISVSGEHKFNQRLISGLKPRQNTKTDRKQILLFFSRVSIPTSVVYYTATTGLVRPAGLRVNEIDNKKRNDILSPKRKNIESQNM